MMLGDTTSAGDFSYSDIGKGALVSLVNAGTTALVSKYSQPKESKQSTKDILAQQFALNLQKQQADKKAKKEAEKYGFNTYGDAPTVPTARGSLLPVLGGAAGIALLAGGAWFFFKKKKKGARR